MSQGKRDKVGIVIGTASGAVGGGVMGGFVIGMPGIIGAVAAGLVGVLLGGYAGAVIGGFFGTDTVVDESHPAEEETGEKKAA